MSTNQSLQKREIHFNNGNRAWSVSPPKGTRADDILRALDISRSQALIMIAGGAANLNEALAPHLAKLCSDGITRAAAHTHAMIIDGGTQAGVMEILGQSLVEHHHKITLLGVAPAAMVTYPGAPQVRQELMSDSAPLDPNHSHFVLVESDMWGGETETMYALAEALSEHIPVMTLIVNGGTITKTEALRSIRYGWPLLVIEGSGRLADEIAGQWGKKSAQIEDEEEREIIAEGNICLFPAMGSPNDLMQCITELILPQRDSA